MAIFSQLLIAGIATGAIYALIAVGFALLWQTSETINFAQGEFVMIAGFIILGMITILGVGVIPAFLITLPIMMLLLGLLFKQLLVSPLIAYGDFPLVIATIGLGILLKEGAKLIWGANALPFPEVVPDHIFKFMGVRASVADLTTLGIAIVIIIVLQYFLNHTFTGRSMEATAQNPEVARKFSNGETLGLLAFMAAIVGGFNQVRGALIGGFLIGILENLGAFYISTQYRTAFPIILLILVILFKPEGLFGRPEERTI